MSLFGRKPKVRTVSVGFRDLTSDHPVDPARAYLYVWDLPENPEVGMRVFVPGGDGKLAPAVIADLNPQANARNVSLKAVRRVATATEIAAAHAKADQASTDWLEMARKAAGLPSRSRRTKAPEGYPEIAPADGEATKAQANEYGRMWWRALKLAEAQGLPSEEVKVISAIAHRWYAIRDRS